MSRILAMVAPAQLVELARDPRFRRIGLRLVDFGGDKNVVFQLRLQSMALLRASRKQSALNDEPAGLLADEVEQAD